MQGPEAVAILVRRICSLRVDQSIQRADRLDKRSPHGWTPVHHVHQNNTGAPLSLQDVYPDVPATA